MAVLTRITDFIPNTLIVSQEVDDEFNQLVNILSGVSTNKDALIKYSDGSGAVLRVDQLGAGLIQQWLQNGSVKSRINNNGSFESIAGPALAASQTITAPLTIDGSPDIILKANGQIVGYPRKIFSSTTSVGNVGAGLDSLHSFSLPAASLATDGDSIDWTSSGSLATAGPHNRRWVFSIGGQTIRDTGNISLTNNALWTTIINAVRVSDTTIRCSFMMNAGGSNVGATNFFTYGWNALLTVSSLMSNGQTILVQAEDANAANDNITQNLSTIYLTQTA